MVRHSPVRPASSPSRPLRLHPTSSRWPSARPRAPSRVPIPPHQNRPAFFFFREPYRPHRDLPPHRAAASSPASRRRLVSWWSCCRGSTTASTPPIASHCPSITHVVILCGGVFRRICSTSGYPAAAAHLPAWGQVLPSDYVTAGGTLQLGAEPKLIAECLAGGS